MTKVRYVDSSDSARRVASKGRNYTDNMKISLLVAAMIVSLVTANTYGNDSFSKDYLVPEKQSIEVNLEESYEPKGRRR